MQATSTLETRRGRLRPVGSERIAGSEREPAHQRTLRTASPSGYLTYRRYGEVALTLLLLPVLLPVMFLIAVAIRLDSSGPILFRQQRVGLGGRQFTMLKFRSMIARDDAGQFPVTSPRDPRVTRVGRFLRSSHMDELPQVFNVLRGDMGVIGPRPEIWEMGVIYDHLLIDYWMRHQVRPGMTGLAQVRRGYADTVEKTVMKLRDDLEYIQRLSFRLDLEILIRTAPLVFCLRGR